MMALTSKYIQTNGIQIHYERFGGNNPPVIMSHGITDNGRCLLRLGQYLASRYDVFLVDARGHGLSDTPPTGYSADHHADDLYGLVTTLGLEDPILYGHSMGARTVVRFASKYSSIPRKIVLEDPVYLIPPTEQEMAERDTRLREWAAEILGWRSMSLEEHLEIAKQQGLQDWMAEEQTEWAKARLLVSPNVIQVGTDMHLIRTDFPQIKCPVLILKADADDDTRAKNEEAAGLIPNHKIIHVTGAGHNIRRENFAATTAYIDQFLAHS